MKPSGPPAPGGRHRFIVGDDEAGRRLDHVLAERLAGIAGLSRTRLQTLIAEGHVVVSDRPARVASGKLVPGATISIEIPAPVQAEPVGQPIPLDILFEDEHLVVLDKPAGLVVHPAAGHDDGTLVNALIAHCGDSLSGIGGVRRPGIVHRLDKDTSGVMVAAKTDAAHQGLAALFADHGRSGSLERCYHAVVWSHPAAPHGTVDQPLGRHPHHRERMSIVPAGRGKPAVTHWQVARPLQGASLVHCRLETGRTHQIRVHMTAIGHPLIGDPVYGTGFRTKAARLPEPAAAAVAAFDRQALHAATLGFEHPVTGRPLSFTSPLPPDLAGLISALSNP